MNKRRLLILPAELKFSEAEDGEMEIEATITTQGIDRHNEVVETSGLRNADDFSEEVLPLALLWEHWQQIGHSRELKFQKRQIKTRSTLAPTSTVLNEVWPLVQHGSLKAISIGFIGHGGEEDKKGIWHWTDWSLIEHSLVSTPANTQAIVSLAKSMGFDSEPMVVAKEDVLERKELSEIELCLERIERLTGAAQGVHDIAIHWQGAGELLSALDGDSIDELAQARLHLDAVLLAYQSASEAERSRQLIEGLRTALGK